MVSSEEVLAFLPGSVSVFYGMVRTVVVTGEAAQAGLLSKEKPFTLRLERDGKSVLVQGIIDCYFNDGDGLVLVDYKSNRLSYKHREADIERIREEYLEQINLYRSALEEGIGLSVKEAYLYLLDKSITISML